MRTSKAAAPERQGLPLTAWISGTITVYPRHGSPKQVRFPCTWETQLLFQRLEQQQLDDQRRRSE